MVKLHLSSEFLTLCIGKICSIKNTVLDSHLPKNSRLFDFTDLVIHLI